MSKTRFFEYSWWSYGLCILVYRKRCKIFGGERSTSSPAESRQQRINTINMCHPPTYRGERPGRCFPDGQIPPGLGDPAHASPPAPPASPSRVALTTRPPRERPPQPPHRAPGPPASRLTCRVRGPRRHRRRTREPVPRAEVPGARRPRLASAPPGGQPRRRAAGSGSAQTGFSCSRPNRQATPRGGAGEVAGRGLTSRPAPSGQWAAACGGRARAFLERACVRGRGWWGLSAVPGAGFFCWPGAAAETWPGFIDAYLGPLSRLRTT